MPHNNTTALLLPLLHPPQDLIITQSLQANTTASQAPSASAAASGGGTAGGASGGAPPGLAPMPSTAGVFDPVLTVRA
jgi:hypothetical protein